MVYFIRCGRFVKIGTSENATARMSNLQSANPTKLELLAELTGGPKLEKWFHAHFREHRAGREWFRYSSPIHQFVRDHDEYAGFDMACVPEVADRLQTSVYSVYRWVRSGELPAEIRHGRNIEDPAAWWVENRDVDTFLASRTIQPPAPAPARRRRKAAVEQVPQYV